LGTQKKSWDSSRGFFLCKKKAQSHHISRREGGREGREEKRREGVKSPDLDYRF